MSIAGQIAEHLSGLSYDALPAATVHAAKRLILDTLGTGLAGAEEPGCREILALEKAKGGAPVSTIMASNLRLPPSSAAFVNGTYFSALDYDSLHYEAAVHPEIVTLPAALALAEREGSSGRELITAMVAGGDLLCRLALAAPRTGPWFVTSTNGAFGAAAAAGVILGLDPLRMRNALGFALSQANGTIQAVLERTLAKRIQSAFAARNGVEAALLAEAGIDAPREIFSGAGGYFDAFGPGDPASLVIDLGKRFETDATGLKKYPSCACNHATIQACQNLMAAHDLKPENIRRVEVRISPFMMKVVGAPFDPGPAPQVTAQFSAEYSAACTLLRGSVRLRDLSEQAVRDPAIAELIQRITLIEDPALKGLIVPTIVRIDAGDRTFEEIIPVSPGSVDAPLDDDQVVAKFRDCAAYGPTPISARRVDAIIESVLSLETIANVRDLTRSWMNIGDRAA